MPLSPTTWPPRAFNGWASLLFALGTIIVMFVPILGYIVAQVRSGTLRPGMVPAPIEQIVLQDVAYVPVLLFIAIVLPRVARMKWSQLGLRRPRPSELGVALLGVIAMFVIVDLASAAVIAITHRHDTEAAIALLRSMKTVRDRVLFGLTAAVFAPVIEELFFRAFLFNAFARYAPIWLAALLSSLAFGAIHAAGTSPSQLLTVGIPLTFGGAVLAFVYWKTRCLWCNILTHGLFNGIQVVAAFALHLKS